MANNIISDHERCLPALVWSLLGYLWKKSMFFCFNSHVFAWMFGMRHCNPHPILEFDEVSYGDRWRRPHHDGYVGGHAKSAIALTYKPATIVNSDMVPFERRGMYQAIQNILVGFGAVSGASLGGPI